MKDAGASRFVNYLLLCPRTFTEALDSFVPTPSLPTSRQEIERHMSGYTPETKPWDGLQFLC